MVEGAKGGRFMCVNEEKWAASKVGKTSDRVSKYEAVVLVCSRKMYQTRKVNSYLYLRQNYENCKEKLPAAGENFENYCFLRQFLHF